MSAKDELPMLGHVNIGGEYDSDTVDNAELLARRKQYFAGSFLFFQNPVHLVRGRGVWMYDDKGRQYLDGYNNIPNVGHCHPKVVRAIHEQAKRLNTHTRYLHENVIDLAERLAGTMPDGLDVSLFSCTGTEAAELSMRLARAVTGNTGIIVMEGSYHGNSKLVGEMSTAVYAPDQRPAWIEAIEPPNTYRGPYREGEEDLGKKYADLADAAIAKLNASGHGVAAFVCDSIFDSQGTLEAPPEYLQRIYAKVRAAGGLCVADEVQAGFGRTGKYWGFEHYNVVPDIVFTGKPMGNGHPVSSVTTSHEIADKWSQSDIYFNTFGGNPVSAAAANAMMQVMEDEKLVANCQKVGSYFRSKLEELSKKHTIIGDVRGRGLFLGVELVKDRDSKDPAAEVSALIPDRMKDAGILIGMTGRYGNVLKFRMPLVTNRSNVDLMIRTLDKVLSQLPATASVGVHRINDGIITESTLARLSLADGKQLSVGRAARLTPLAIDKARELGISIIPDTT
jgi:4-aminobutyrate aminotransferase-like enzyme